MEYGVPRTEDFNCGEIYGVGEYQVNQHRGRRWTAAHAFLTK